MSGRPDYDVGDLVVAVGPPPGVKRMKSSGALKKGSVYTVTGLIYDRPSGEWGVKIKEAQSPIAAAFRALSFRRIDPKPPEFWTGEVEANQRDKVPA